MRKIEPTRETLGFVEREWSLILRSILEDILLRNTYEYKGASLAEMSFFRRDKYACYDEGIPFAGCLVSERRGSLTQNGLKYIIRTYTYVPVSLFVFHDSRCVPR